MAAVSDNGVLRGPTPAPLGALLVSRGLLSEEQLTDALAEQAAVGRPLGAILVQRGYVRPAVIAQALATQHGGILKSEYGYGTGFDARLVEEAETKPEPPVSPAGSGLGAALRLSKNAGPVRPDAPLQEARPAPVQPSRVDTLEMELAAAAAENQKLRARLGELQMELGRNRSESETFRQRAAVVGARVAGLEAAVAALQAEKAQPSAASHP